MNKNGEINFIIETFDQYLLLSKSYLYLEGLLTNLDDSKLTNDNKVTLTNNAPMFLFDRASYSLNGSQIENIRNSGRVSLMKAVLSYSSNLNKQNIFGWILESSTAADYKINKYVILRRGKESFCISLNHIFRFSECYVELNNEKYPYECLRCNFTIFNAV